METKVKTPQALLDNAEYMDLKDQAIKGQLLKFETLLSDIKILKEDRISMIVNGNHQEMPITPTAFANLCRICQTPESFLSSFTKYTKGQNCDKIDITVVEMMRQRVAIADNTMITLIGSPKVGKIIGVGQNISVLSPESFFELFEEMMGKYDLVLTDMSIDHLGSVTLKTQNPSASQGIEIENTDWDEDETYTPGLAFVNDALRGTMVMPYQLRQICTNGMIGMTSSEKIQIGELNQESLQKFYEQLNVLAANGFASTNYHQQVVKAINTMASLNEIKTAYDALKAHVGGEDADMTLDRYVPYVTVCAEYRRMGIEIGKMSKAQMKNANTGIPLWEIINGVTDFASHEVPGVSMSPSSRSYLQGIGGMMLHKKIFDTENLVPPLR